MNAGGMNFENNQFSPVTGFGWGPPEQGQFVMPRASAATFLQGNTLFLWGGQGYTFLQKGHAASGAVEIRSDLCSISARDGKLYGRIIATDLPPISDATLSFYVEKGDSLFYVSGGIGFIRSNGDTVISKNDYRYNLTTKVVQQFDTTTAQWGNLQTSVEADMFPSSPELAVEMPVYPNPANGMIQFSLKEGVLARSVKVYNQLGQLVLQWHNPQEHRIDLSGQAAGLYFLRVDTAFKPFYAKIIKK
jgi:hypothetical protein